ncbi:SIS domain-containing protein [Nonomuraea sp. NPDC050556]|uniref:SIS domain-containing protein n=1 Tax=Nonomuraea sp. NPDC050556 TaxID=3364369 RepID=UPI0037AD8F4D
MSRITFREGQAEQPRALHTIASHVRRRLAEPDLAHLRGAARPLFTGIGASHAALAVPVDLLRTRGVVTQRVLSSEIGQDARGFEADVVIGVSQGGRSTETLAAFSQLRDVPRVAVLNVTPSPLSSLADHTVDLGNQPDSYASTIGFTGTVVALDLIASLISGASHGDPWAQISAQALAVRDRTLFALATVQARAARCVAADVVASGTSRTSSEEAALLLREVARMPAAASVTRNYLHGEMESAGQTLHVVFGDGRELALARTLSAAGHLTLLVTTQQVDSGPDLAVVRLPEAAPSARVVLETVVAQELAGSLADERGIAIESFVFANDDTKEGGVDPADFAISSQRR